MEPCPHIPRVSAYQDGELLPEHRALMEQHLLECASCTAELESLRRLSGLLSRQSPPAQPPDLLQQLHSQVDSLTDRSLLRFAQLLSGIAAAVLVASAIWMGRDNRASGETTAPWESAAVVFRPQTPAQSSSFQTAQWIVMQLSPERRDE